MAANLFSRVVRHTTVVVLHSFGQGSAKLNSGMSARNIFKLAVIPPTEDCRLFDNVRRAVKQFVTVNENRLSCSVLVLFLQFAVNPFLLFCSVKAESAY